MKALLLARAMTAVLLTTPAQAVDVQTPQTDGFLTNGEPITEESVLELLRQLEVEWPGGTPWDDPKLSPDTRKNTVSSVETGKLMRNYCINGVYGCGGYASMISSLIFGDKVNPCRRVEDLSQIRPGDIIFRVSNATGKIWHVTVALSRPTMSTPTTSRTATKAASYTGRTGTIRMAGRLWTAMVRTGATTWMSGPATRKVFPAPEIASAHAPQAWQRGKHTPETTDSMHEPPQQS